MAHARIAARVRRAKRHRAFRRAHALQRDGRRGSAEDIAQAIDSIGGQLDAFTAKEYASYYIKVLDEHLPLAVDILSDIVMRPAFEADEIEREKKVILEEIKMVEDTPDDLVHEIFTQQFWEGHPLGRPILGSKETVEAFTPMLRESFRRRVRRAEHDRLGGGQSRARDACAKLIENAFGASCRDGEHVNGGRLRRAEGHHAHQGARAEPHLSGHDSYPQSHDDRYVSYILNTVLGGSMSSRLFQNVREKRGLAYSVFSGLSAYRDAGNITIYAGCAAEAVEEVDDLCVEELRGMKRAPSARAGAARAKDISRAA